MQCRQATILAPEDLGASGTKVLNINVDSPISRITIDWQFTVVTVSVMTARVIDCLSKIELVDGSDVLWSVSGSQLAGLNFYNKKRLQPYQASLTVGGVCRQSVSIDFGRWLWDMMYAFPVSRFKNPQLRITFDEDAANGSVVVNSMSVYADVMDDMPSQPVAFLTAKQYFSYPFTASSHEYIELPTDQTIRQILFQAESEDHDPVVLLSKIKLSINNDKKVPLNIDADDFYFLIQQKYPRVSYMMTLDDAVTAKTIYADLSRDLHIDIQYDETDFVTAQSNLALPTYTGHKIALAASVDIAAQKAQISGTLPFNILPYLIGDEWDSTQWLDHGMIDSLVADITASSDADSGDTHNIVLEQVRPA